MAYYPERRRMDPFDTNPIRPEIRERKVKHRSTKTSWFSEVKIYVRENAAAWVDFFNHVVFWILLFFAMKLLWFFVQMHSRYAALPPYIRRTSPLSEFYEFENHCHNTSRTIDKLLNESYTMLDAILNEEHKLFIPLRVVGYNVSTDELRVKIDESTPTYAKEPPSIGVPIEQDNVCESYSAGRSSAERIVRYDSRLWKSLRQVTEELKRAIKLFQLENAGMKFARRNRKWF